MMMIQEYPVLNQPGLNGITEGVWTLRVRLPSQASVIQKARRMQMQVPCQSRASDKRLFQNGYIYIWLYSY